MFSYTGFSHYCPLLELRLRPPLRVAPQLQLQKDSSLALPNGFADLSCRGRRCQTTKTACSR